MLLEKAQVLSRDPGTARRVVLEPGDGTHYDLVVSLVGDVYHVVDRVHMEVLEFTAEEKREFVRDTDEHLSRNTYPQWAVDAMEHITVKSIIFERYTTMTKLNPWTIVAALCAAHVSGL